MGLIEDLGRGPVALDTVVFIYFIEEHPRYLDLVRQIFEGVAARRFPAVTSALTLLEVLVRPYRAGNAALAGRYEALLTRSRGLQLIDLSRVQLQAAAQVRAAYAVRTPAALQLAAALASRSTAFVTNDRQIPAIPGLTTILLDRCLR